MVSLLGLVSTAPSWPALSTYYRRLGLPSALGTTGCSQPYLAQGRQGGGIHNVQAHTAGRQQAAAGMVARLRRASGRAYVQWRAGGQAAA